ncbi:hypothetical protein [Flavobacterium chungangense]|uniref:Uncharacterized protein n=1 Tax=Flavobacterium chungangense TaxID=554283 RepID=A0A6V6Z8L9_9FLAO|nr:hypothetical protein [Flavobacterium chungangense]CAD0008110.1 hypothetical protein FLACHUCJ7_03641 [Flavobacterium chungangense]
MFNLFKKQNEIPEFNIINKYSKKDMYFSRIRKWDWLNAEQIYISEKYSNEKVKMITLDYWSQEMFLDSDGQKTVSEYLQILINQFQKSKMKIPSDLDQFMIEILESLNTDLGAIEFSNKPITLRPEFEKPLTNK